MVTTTEMLTFINSDPETGKAFKALVKLESKEFKYQGSTRKAREALLDAMIEKNCYGNMERVQRFIMYNYTQRNVLGSPDRLLHGYRGVRI